MEANSPNALRARCGRPGTVRMTEPASRRDTACGIHAVLSNALKDIIYGQKAICRTTHTCNGRKRYIDIFEIPLRSSMNLCKTAMVIMIVAALPVTAVAAQETESHGYVVTPPWRNRVS
jgi:hypothetical protein